MILVGLGIEVLEILDWLKLFLSLSDDFLMIFGEEGQWVNEFGMEVLFFLLDFKIFDDVLGDFWATVVADFWGELRGELLNLLFEF
jgi:hypothetical protein